MDPSGAAIAGATVTLNNPVTNYKQTGATDQSGAFRFSNVPLGAYHLNAQAAGFAPLEQQVQVHSPVPIDVDLKLPVAGAQTSIEVQAGGVMVENVPVAHNDVDENALANLPVESPAAGLSSVITLSTPGVVADSNGFFHPLGDHAQTSYYIDGQPISDQQSKAFSTQIPVNAIQSMELITGMPSAQYGDKTSLVVDAATKSGLGRKPFGEFDTTYGSFGEIGENASFGWGSAKLGNFLVADTDRSGRFLDTPEFYPMHDIGNNETFFDRLDYQPGGQGRVPPGSVRRPQLVSDSQYLRPAQPGPAPAGGQLQHRPRLPAHLRRQDADHGEPLGAARLRELLSQPRSLRRRARHRWPRTGTC